MITSFFLTLLSNFLSGLIFLLPEGHISANITSAIQTFWSIGNSFSYVVPVSTLLSALFVVVAFEVVLLLWSLIQWIIRKIPGMQ